MVWLPAFLAVGLLNGLVKGYDTRVHISTAVMASISYMLPSFLLGYWTWRALTPGKNVWASTASGVIVSLFFLAWDYFRG